MEKILYRTEIMWKMDNSKQNFSHLSLTIKYFRKLFWRVCKHCFAFTLTPCTNYVMIVTYDCLSIFITHGMWWHPCPLVSAKALVLAFITMSVLFFLSSNVLTRCASSSLLCRYHSCSICSLCSFQLQLLQNTVWVLHDFTIQQLCFFFH